MQASYSTSILQTAAEPALSCVQQLSRRLPELTVTARKVKGSHGWWAELVQECVKEARRVRGAAAQPVAFFQCGQRVSRRAEETVSNV